MIIDAHIHCSGEEKAADVIRALDWAEVDKAVILAPFLTGNYSLRDRESLLAANEHLAQLVGEHKDRLIGFAVINPLLPDACDDLARAHELGLTGLKMVPSGWYPYDDCAHRIYETAESLDVPILFHTG